MDGYFENPAATAEALQRRLAAYRRPRLHRGRRALRLRTDQGPDHPAGAEVSPARSRIGDRRLSTASGRRASSCSASTTSSEADEVVAVLEARASQAPDDVVDTCAAGSAKRPDSSSIASSSTPPGTIPRTTSGKVRRAETRARVAGRHASRRLRPADSSGADERCSTSCNPSPIGSPRSASARCRSTPSSRRSAAPTEVRHRRPPHADVRVQQLLRPELPSRRHRGRAGRAGARRRRHDRLARRQRHL